MKISINIHVVHVGAFTFIWTFKCIVFSRQLKTHPVQFTVVVR